MAIPAYIWLPPSTSFFAIMGCPSITAPYLTPYSIVFVITCTAVTSTAILHVYRVMIKLNSEKSSNRAIEALSTLLPFLVFFPALFVYMCHSSIALPHYPILTVSIQNPFLSKAHR
jgi:hypothetical protein